MTHRTAPRLAAFALAFAVTVAVLAGIDGLATGGPAGAQWAATAAAVAV